MLRLEREWAKTKAAQRMRNALVDHAFGPSNPASEVLQLTRYRTTPRSKRQSLERSRKEPMVHLLRRLRPRQA